MNSLITRRASLLSPLAAAACSSRESESGWPARWDRLLIEKAVDAAGRRYDPSQKMIQTLVGPEYRYHTNIRNYRPHLTRESLEYALYLLEQGSRANTDRAKEVIERVIALQVTDPESKWYGIWGWFMEEPPDKMSPADWNWADFNGATLLLIEFRHGPKLGEELRARVHESILHAARSVMRRNVSMNYTNIAVQGTFVTLAAAELLNDQELVAYAKDRIVRLAAAIDQTGSFAEYNSPTYAHVSVVNLTRIRMYVRDQEAKHRAAAIERRVWLHLAAHWDAARMQLAGPMSRSYGNDIGQPLWLEKALGRRLRIASPENRTDAADGETAIHDLRCPPSVADRFLSPRPNTEHRELFVLDPPTSGTTYFSRSFSLGTANRSDFWVQRRPLLAYFGDRARPARAVQLRVIKDGYDFSSALFYSVQQKGRVLGLINFRNPGGDKHISLDPIKDGQFACGRLFAELDFEGLDEGFRYEEREGTLELKSSLLQARFRFLAARFGTLEPKMKVTRAAQSLTVTLDFKPLDTPRRVRWADVRQAYAAFALELADVRAPFTGQPVASKAQAGVIHLTWGPLELKGSTLVAPVEEQNLAFEDRIAGQAVPTVRLSEEKLA